MTGRPADPFPLGRRIQQQTAWLKEPGNQELLRAAAKQHRVHYLVLTNLLQRLVTATYSKGMHAGCVAESRQQLAEAIGLSGDQVKRGLAALDAAGVLVTERRQHSPGRGGGAGRPAVRRVTFVVPVEDAAPVDKGRMTAHETRNDGAYSQNDGTQARQLAGQTNLSLEVSLEKPPTRERSEARQTSDQHADGRAVQQRQEKPGTELAASSSEQNWLREWTQELTRDDSGLWPPVPAKNPAGVQRHRRDTVTTALRQVLDATQPGGQVEGYCSLVLSLHPAAPTHRSDGWPLPASWGVGKVRAVLTALVGNEPPDWLTLRQWLHKQQPTPAPTPTPTPTPAPPRTKQNPVTKLTNAWSA